MTCRLDLHLYFRITGHREGERSSRRVRHFRRTETDNVCQPRSRNAAALAAHSAIDGISFGGATGTQWPSSRLAFVKLFPARAGGPIHFAVDRHTGSHCFPPCAGSASEALPVRLATAIIRYFIGGLGYCIAAISASFERPFSEVSNDD
jgi:hypothetical protein